MGNIVPATRVSPFSWIDKVMEEVEKMARKMIRVEAAQGHTVEGRGARTGEEVEQSLVFRTMRSRSHDVVLVRRTINLGYWEFGMGRGCMGRG
jgi:hypothetical protein